MTNEYPFGFDQPEDSPGFSLWQVSVLWQRKIKAALDEYNIAHSSFVIMAVLHWLGTKNHQPTQVTIVKLTKLDKMTVSKMLKILAHEGYVQRTENTNDTRAKTVKLTKSGQELVKTLVPIVESVDKQFFDKINQQDQTTILKLLQELARGNG